MRWAWLAIGCLGCELSPAPVPPPKPMPRPAAVTPPPPTFMEWANLPGCTHEEAERVTKELARVEPMMSEKKAAPAPIVDVIGGAWKSPCLAHVARLFPAPRPTTLVALHDLWFAGLRGVRAVIGGLYERDGHRFMWIPPTSPPPLGDDARRALDPFLCAGTACGHAASFQARAEKAFDADEARLISWHARQGWPVCEHASDQERRTPAPSAFESWALCVVQDLPRSHRYARDVKLAALDHGFLVLRGRRGHYGFSDEARVYDLASGAAWIARSTGALVLGGVSVDHAATDAGRKLDAFTGNVLAETVRELAFVALTKSAVVPTRTEMMLVPVPADLRLELSARAPELAFAIDESGWSTSAQTKLSFAIVLEDKILADGRFTYPDSADPAEQQADDLLEVLEAGLERGCPRAKLPKRLGKSTASGASPIDADASGQIQVARDLDRALEGLRAGCP